MIAESIQCPCVVTTLHRSATRHTDRNRSAQCACVAALSASTTLPLHTAVCEESALVAHTNLNQERLGIKYTWHPWEEWVLILCLCYVWACLGCKYGHSSRLKGLF